MGMQTNRRKKRGAKMAIGLLLVSLLNPCQAVAQNSSTPSVSRGQAESVPQPLPTDAEVRDNVALGDSLFKKPSGPPGGTAPIQGKPAAPTSAAARSVERGTFRIFETKQVQGEESYEITREGREYVIRSKFNLPYWGEEKKPSLTATLRTDSDLTPRSFEIKGVKPTEVGIDTSVEVRGRVADVREDGRRRRVSVPERFFALTGYAPVALEMMLVRYWLSHEQKGPLKILPGGEVLVERRGVDTITAGSKPIKLARYSLGGLAWGRQTLWLDAAQQLVAVVNLGGDVETNFYALREGYGADLLPFFLKRAAEDGVDRLTRLGDQISPRRAGALVLLGATLIDGTGKAPISDSVVVIEGDRITAAGVRTQVAIPKGATVIDATGKYVLPGLWDMHAHLYQVEFGPAYLAAGITTARDVGNDLEFATTLREAARQGRGLQPRLLLAGYIDGKNEGHSFDIQVDTPEEARSAVRRYKEAGYEQIKIRDHVKPDILKVIAAEAHRLGMTLVGHVPKGMDAVQAVEAGMDQISHLNFAATAFESKGDDGQEDGGQRRSEGSDEPKSGEHPKGGERRQEGVAGEFDYPEARRAIRVFKEHGTVLDPTMATLELFVRPQNEPLEKVEPGFKKVAPELIPQLEKKGLPPEAAQQGAEACRQFLSLLGALHRAGIPIVAGTDVSIPGHSLHRELELYVRAGFTPLEAIQAATLVPARVMGLERETGTVEAGKRADLLVLDANPLEDISNIRTVKFVVARGRLYDSARLWESIGFRP